MNMRLTFLMLMNILFLLSVAPPNDASDIVNLEVYSKIDLRKNFALVENIILFINRGPEIITSYNYSINDLESHQIRFYDQEGFQLDATEIKSPTRCYVVQFNKPIRSNETYPLRCTLTFANKILPATKHRQMEEDQLMKFHGNLRFFSAYHTDLSKIDYILKEDSSVVEITEEPTFTTNQNLTYIFNDTPEFDSSQLKIVFVNNDAFFAISSLQRSIDINHFGKIVIQDDVVLRNIGPQFVGPYNIHSLQKKKGQRNWLYTHLPASAENIKFFDNLGNSSGTKIFFFPTHTTLKFKTRYPLLGGWKTSYVLRYEVPTHEYLFTSNDSFVLKIRAIDQILNGMETVNNAVVKIFMPEGAHVMNVTKTAMLNLEKEEVSCPGSLCVFGRPTIVLTGKNLFNNYLTTLKVEYSLHECRLLRAPFLISVYLELIFVGIICSRRYLL